MADKIWSPEISLLCVVTYKHQSVVVTCQKCYIIISIVLLGSWKKIPLLIHVY